MVSTQILTTKHPACKEKQPTQQLEKIYANDFQIHASSKGRIIKERYKSPNAFYTTINLAYSRHIPLTLDPDDVWLMIAKGVSAHINYNSEKLRYKFVQHEGKEDIKVFCDEYRLHSSDRNMEQIMSERLPPLDWSLCVNALTEEVERRTHQNVNKIITCDFSTTTPIYKTSSQIILLDSMKNYFNYICALRCGIPQITLLGVLEDWQRILEKIQQLRKLDIDLEWWLDRLEPIINQFIATYKGQVDYDFWATIRTVTPFGSGPTIITGWVLNFFPYDCNGKKINGSLTEDSIPSSLVQVPFILDDNGREHKLEFISGLMGTQQLEDMSIKPCAGWLVVKQADEKNPNLEVNFV